MFKVNKLLLQAQNSLKRFPLVVLIGLLGAVFGSILTENRDFELSEFLIKMMIGCVVTLPIQLAVYLKKEKNPEFSPVFIVLTPLMIPLIYFLIDKVDTQSGIYKFFAAYVTSHLFFSWFVYSKETEKEDFWEINQLFLQRISVSFSFTVILYLGIIIALASLNALLGIKFSPNIYAHLLIWLAAVFHTLIFLNGLPNLKEEKLNTWNAYPPQLKVLTQYILLPLVILYLVILYLYFGKIAIEWNLPKGWVSYLVLCFSIAGILSLLLVEPLKNLEENQWIKVFSYWFYRALLPLNGLLFLSIGVRIYHYGFTEPRYFVFLLAIWLLFVTIYFLISKSKNIQMIPISLTVAGVISFVFPISASYVSRTSQISRFLSIMEANGGLKEGKIVKIEWKNQKNKNRAYNIAKYLLNNHDPKIFNPYLTEAQLEELQKNYEYDKKTRYAMIDRYLKVMNLEFAYDYENPYKAGRLYFLTNKQKYPNRIEKPSTLIDCFLDYDQFGSDSIYFKHLGNMKFKMQFENFDEEIDLSVTKGILAESIEKREFDQIFKDRMPIQVGKNTKAWVQTAEVEMKDSVNFDIRRMNVLLILENEK